MSQGNVERQNIFAGTSSGVPHEEGREGKLKFRAALAREGERPDELMREQEDLAKEERRLQTFERRPNEEKRGMEEGIMIERNHMQERIVAMAA